MVKLLFAVTASSGVEGSALFVDDQNVPLNNGKGSLSLPAGDYILIWHFVGDAGETIAITGKSNGQTVVEVKKSTIPNGAVKSGGLRRFSLKDG